MRAVSASPAKVILFGEHFVVNGNSAISMAIDLPTIVTAESTTRNGVTITSKNMKLEAHFSPNGTLEQSTGTSAEQNLRPIYATVSSLIDKTTGIKISIESHVPIGMGLGSSAATAVATLSSVTTLLQRVMQKEEIFQAAYSLEKLIHGRPSGVDQATVTYGGMIVYRNGRVESKLADLSKPPLIIIGNTGKRRSTGKYVGRVTQLRTEQPQQYSHIAHQAQRIADQAIIALMQGRDTELGALMNENQRLLETIGVSSPSLDNLIAAALSAGALGAKLTGGGGGGCMIALANEATASTVKRAIEEAGGEIISGSFVPYGVKVTDWSN